MRVFNYLIITVGMMILFYLAGIESGTSYVVNKLNIINPEGLGSTNFAIVIAAVFTAAVVVGVAIGFITKSPSESYILAAYATVLLLFVADMTFTAVYMSKNYSGWLGWLTILIIMPLAIGFYHSIVSWWGGKG